MHIRSTGAIGFVELLNDGDLIPREFIRFASPRDPFVILGMHKQTRSGDFDLFAFKAAAVTMPQHEVPGQVGRWLFTLSHNLSAIWTWSRRLSLGVRRRPTVRCLRRKLQSA